MAESDTNALSLRDTKFDEFQTIATMEQGDASEFILPASRERHEQDSTDPRLVYKSITLERELIGFVILGVDADGFSLEMRRIVVAQPGHGYGTKAMRLIDDVARQMGRGRIWLDVFEQNSRARHVYESCGYVLFGDTELNGRRLLLFEKLLPS